MVVKGGEGSELLVSDIFRFIFAVRAGLIMHNMRNSVMMWIIITQWPLVIIR